MNMDHVKTVLLAAGGTGGHLFPAQSLAHVLAEKGITIHLVTDKRADHFRDDFPAQDVHVIAADTVRGRNPIALARTAYRLTKGFFASVRLLREIKPEVVVGFGGYPTLPPLLAAVVLRIPTIIHEQNAVVGRANSFLARWVKRVATGFNDPRGLQPQLINKAIHTGNPVRPLVLAAADVPYAALEANGAFNLVVFGGSQGARVFSDVLPEALALMPSSQRWRLHLTQQVRAEDLDRVQARYLELGVRADIAAFFNDLPLKLAHAHLVIARAGASTVAELAALGRPALLVPLPGSLDQDQKANAEALADWGGAEVVLQAEFTPQKCADILLALMNDAHKLQQMAAASRKMAALDAPQRLADVVLLADNSNHPTQEAA